MEGYIPKEKLTAYERWELAAFDEAEQLRRQAPPEPEPEPAVAAEPPPPPPPSAEEIEAIRDAAREAGKAEGFAAGFAAGRAEGMTQALAEAEQLRTLADDFRRVLLGAEDSFAEEMLTLSLEVARQILRTSLRVKPELILPTVREAMATLVSQHGHPVLQLNPDDAQLVREQLGEQFSHTGWRLSENPALGRGECRVENAGSEVDATLATRWRRVVEAIGANSDWIEDGQ